MAPEHEATRRFTYIVTVATDTAEHAAQVLGARLGYDEDLGFDYTLDFHPVTGEQN